MKKTYGLIAANPFGMKDFREKKSGDFYLKKGDGLVQRYGILLESGEFDQGDAVTEIELRSQFGTVDAELVDESQYACSSAASLYCGTGGCMLNLVVNGETMAWQVTGWRLIDWGPDRILLIGRDGGWCGGAGAEVCYEALVWSEDRILTLGPAVD